MEDLSEQRRFDALVGEPSLSRRFDAGRVWASAFWELRSAIGADVIDKVLVDAWVTTPLNDHFDAAFVANVCASDGSGRAKSIFLHRGFKQPTHEA